MKELICKTRDGGEIKILYYSAQSQNRPLLIEVHGGGFIYSSAYTDRLMCEMLAQKNDLNVASVDYRLAPKYVYPTATNDCVDALNYLINDKTLDFDRERIVALGESAGANIVAGLCYLNKGQIKGQILLYPFLNAKEDKRKRVLASFSHRQLKKINDTYYPDKSRRGEFTASPNLGNAEDYKGLPPALVITTGIDTLRIDGLKFVQRLQENGVKCRYIDYPKAMHGYFEDVPKGAVDKFWWASKKSKEIQKQCYKSTLEEISKFIK